MAYTAPWRGLARSAPWPAPSGDALATVHLLGDCQTEWELVYPQLSPLTAFDAMGRDIRDRLIMKPPDAFIQMGDVNDKDPFDKPLILSRFDLFRRWLGDYGIPQPWMVAGNHDLIADGRTPILSLQDWAEYWGYPGGCYTIDLGQVRVIVLAGSGTGYEIDPDLYTTAPIRPMTDADLAWLDTELTRDRRPTLIAAHGPLYGSPSSGGRDWRNFQSTIRGNMQAADLFNVMDSHPHLIGWMHGHTHSHWERPPENLNLLNVGSRFIALIDASAVYTKADGTTQEPTTFYVSVLDDGKTSEVRWRSHHKHTWDDIAGARYRRLTAT